MAQQLAATAHIELQTDRKAERLTMAVRICVMTRPMRALGLTENMPSPRVPAPSRPPPPPNMPPRLGSATGTASPVRRVPDGSAVVAICGQQHEDVSAAHVES